jgi:phospholipid N-methyltransferase
MEMLRRVEAEWLDELPPADPRARRSRRDLKRVNSLMSNAAIVARELRRALAQRRGRIAEIGAGDGSFALALARRLGPIDGCEFTLLDRQPLITPETLEGLSQRGCQAHSVEADVFDWLRQASTPVFDAMVANLFLHHFEPRRLAELLELAASHARVFIACEPRRSGAALLGSRLLGLVGCNDVTRHDAVVSVHAGFRGRELAAAWPDGGAWVLEEGARNLFSHCFVARVRC